MNKKELGLYIGDKIREYRTRNKLTQGELAKKLGVKNNTVSSYERGVNTPKQNMLFKIARVFNISVDDLFPIIENDFNVLDQLPEHSNEDFSVEDMLFLRKLTEKALSLSGEERDKFLASIKFTVDYYNKMNDN